MQCPRLCDLPPAPPGTTGWPWTEESVQLPHTMPDGQPWPRLSVITPSFNQGRFLEATLRSITSPIVTVEDHWPEGGLGDAVLGALADQDERPRVVKLAVKDLPHSGKPAELLAAAGIDAAAIEAAARELVRVGVS